MTLLLLGGTADARRVAQALHERGVPLIYSVAGLVRTPNVRCPVVSGGFSQFGGLQRYIERWEIGAILDITHPFAQTMSTTAVGVARAHGIPCWRFHRRAWEPQAGDRWQTFAGWPALIPALADKRSIFLSAGQLTQTVLGALVQLPQPVGKSRRFLLRTAIEPQIRLPDCMQWIKAIGPFSEADELQLMTGHRIDALVSKNSGGAATQAKLEVARRLGIPVFMLQRPLLPAADAEFDDEIRCVAALLQWYRGGRVGEQASVIDPLHNETGA